MTGRYYGKDHTSNFYPPVGSLVETLPVGKTFDMADIDYFQRKAWISLKVPPSYLLEDAAVVYHENRLAEIPAPINVSEFTSKTCDVQQLAASLSPEAMARVVAAVESTLNVLAYDRAMEILD